jgi:hypothetical protein
LTRKGPEATVRSAFPLREFVLDFLEAEGDREDRNTEPLSRWSTRPGEASNAQGEIPGSARHCNQSREDVDRKVRAER